MANLFLNFTIYLLVFIRTYEARWVEIERRSVTNDTLTHMFLSIDKFPNDEKVSNGKQTKQRFCEMYNATCNGRDCNMCACKDFKTFLSYKAGCVSKQKGDEFLGGKFFL